MANHPGANITTRDIYRKVMNDPQWQADNLVFRITRNLVVKGFISRRHGMALWNLYGIDKQRWNVETLFVDQCYPALSESEACRLNDEAGFEWVDPFFAEGEYYGKGSIDRWEKKGWNE